MYTRFETEDGRGVFCLALAASFAEDEIPPSDRHRLCEILEWFEKFPGRRGGRCWFKSSATEQIQKARQMAMILERNGLLFFERQVQTPGVIVDEDEWQVVVEKEVKDNK